MQCGQVRSPAAFCARVLNKMSTYVWSTRRLEQLHQVIDKDWECVRVEALREDGVVVHDDSAEYEIHPMLPETETEFLIRKVRCTLFRTVNAQIENVARSCSSLFLTRCLLPPFAAAAQQEAEAARACGVPPRQRRGGRRWRR